MNRVTTALDTLKIKAGQIDLATLTVYGGDAETYSNSLLKGLKLAGNDIPKPVYGYTTDKNGGQAGALSSCTLDWESRNTVQKDGKYDTYKVLVLKNCGGSGGGTNPPATTYKMYKTSQTCTGEYSGSTCHPSLAVEGSSCSSPFSCCILTNSPNPSDCPYTSSATWVCNQWVAQNSSGNIWNCR